MLIGWLGNIEHEMKFYPAALREGFEFLMKMDLAALAVGVHEIKGKDIFASVAEYTTEPKSARRAESHYRYIDLQYVVSGREMIGSAPIAGAGEITEKNDDKDLIFYSDLKNESEHILQAGMFVVYFPWDVHRPNCCVEGVEKVKKIVVKIALKLL